MDTETLAEIVAKTVHETLCGIFKNYKLTEITPNVPPPPPPVLVPPAPPVPPSYSEYKKLITEPTPPSSSEYRKLITELVALKKAGELSYEILSRGLKIVGLTHIGDLSNRPNSIVQFRDWVREEVMNESIKRQFPDMFEKSTVVPPAQRSNARKCPSGSWIALSRNAETVIRGFEAKNPGVESRRLKTFKKLRDLLESDPTVTYNNISGIVTQALVRDVIVVTAAPR